MVDVTVLKQALPYIQLYKGRLFVVKLGGELVQDPRILDELAQEISLLHQVGIRIVLVHGGGPQASDLARRLGHEVKMVAGRRVTDDETLEVAKMVFGGKINVEILSALHRHGTRAVGVSGVDGNLVRAKRRQAKKLFNPETGQDEEVDFGHVGDIERVDSRLLRVLADTDYVPVVASLGVDETGNVLNINADTVAAALAGDLKAEKLILLTQVRGLLRDGDNPDSLVSYIAARDLDTLIAQGGVKGGMLPKVTACMKAVRSGVSRAHIIDGTVEHALLGEVFTRAGTGTMILRKVAEAAYLAKEHGA